MSASHENSSPAKPSSETGEQNSVSTHVLFSHNCELPGTNAPECLLNPGFTADLADSFLRKQSCRKLRSPINLGLESDAIATQRIPKNASRLSPGTFYARRRFKNLFS